MAQIQVSLLVLIGMFACAYSVCNFAGPSMNYSDATMDNRFWWTLAQQKVFDYQKKWICPKFTANKLKNFDWKVSYRFTDPKTSKYVNFKADAVETGDNTGLFVQQACPDANSGIPALNMQMLCLRAKNLLVVRACKAETPSVPTTMAPPSGGATTPKAPGAGPNLIENPAPGEPQEAIIVYLYKWKNGEKTLSSGERDFMNNCFKQNNIDPSTVEFSDNAPCMK